jgi:hypothetical protein
MMIAKSRTAARQSSRAGHHRFEIGGLIALLVLVVGASLAVPDHPPRGLLGRYWDNPDWSGSPVRTASATVFGIPTVRRVLPELIYPEFSAEWTGYLSIEKAGLYTFDLKSDDGAFLYVDESPGGGPVVDNGGVHGTQVASGSIELSPGAHRVRLRYAQAGGDLVLSLTWTPPGGLPGPLPPGLLSPDEASAVSPKYLRRRLRLGLAVTGTWVCLLAYLLVRVPGAWLFRSIRDTRPDGVAKLGLAVLGSLAVVLCTWGMRWGLPAWSTWAPDELDPWTIHDGIRRGFSGGWFGLYGPLQYYILAVLLSVFPLMEWLGVLAADVSAQTLQFLSMRAMSVLMGLGTLGVTYLIGVELCDPRRAVLAAATLLLTPTFVYYAKTANVDIPYLWWLSLALLAFVRVIRYGRLKDHVILGVAAAAAVGTKDQAYGFFVLLPLAVVLIEVRRRRERGHGLSPAVVCDRKLVAGGLASAATFALIHNLPLNLAGFLDHVNLIRMSGAAFREFEPSWAGHVQLASSTLVALRWAFGWPACVLSAWGIVSAIIRPDRRWWLWLLVPVASYYLTFLAVTLYVYDRFLLGVQLVCALFAGAAAVDLASQRRWRPVLAAAVLLAYLYSFLNASSVNVMMSRDSRLTAERWIARCIPGKDSVAVIGTELYSPRFVVGEPEWIPGPSVDLRAGQFDWVVVNTRYAKRLQSPLPDRSPLEFLDNEESGYRRVARFRSALPVWAVLGRESAVTSDKEFGLSNIDKINPDIAVYSRSTLSPTCAEAGLH